LTAGDPVIERSKIAEDGFSDLVGTGRTAVNEILKEIMVRGQA